MKLRDSLQALVDSTPNVTPEQRAARRVLIAALGQLDDSKSEFGWALVRAVCDALAAGVTADEVREAARVALADLHD